MTFFDTADVYGDGRSERFCAELHAHHPDVFVATKMGRRVEQLTENYTRENFLAWNDRSRENLGEDRLDLVQLHCPPDGVFESDAVFDWLDQMVADGRIAAYGVSVETVAQALSAIARPARRQRADHPQLLSPQAARAGPPGGARGGRRDHRPSAAGVRSAVGPLRREHRFAADDHRNFNRRGEAFDVGETFAGVPYEVGLAAARRLGELVDEGSTLAQFALRWVIDQLGVSTVIPGARNPDQVIQNTAAASAPPLRAEQLDGVRAVYDELIREHVHARW